MQVQFASFSLPLVPHGPEEDQLNQFLRSHTVFQCQTHPVGTKKANELGLYDMSGNVYEWCWDWYASFSKASEKDPTGFSSGTDRIIRGASWSNEASPLRSAYRNGAVPNAQDNSIGFRVVLPLPK